MRFILTALTVLSAILCYSAEVQWSSRIEGNSIDGGSLQIEDGDYLELSFPNPTFTDVRAFGYVQLGLNSRENMDFESATAGKTIVVNFDITTYDNNYTAQNPVISQSLTIEYNTGSSQVIDASHFRMNGVHKFDVNVTSIEIDNVVISSPNVKNYIYLEAGFYAERYYELDLVSVPNINSKIINYDDQGDFVEIVASATQPNTDEFLIHWDYIDGSEYYDLEWTWVDKYSESGLSGEISASSLGMTEQEFKRNSTRIRTSDQHYTIPHVFAKGYLIYRVRGVGRWLNEPKKDLFGKWSSGLNASVVSNWSYININHEHEGEKNWQYQSTYAENGKKKEVTQYFDGSLRGRQTVTRINSDKNSIVGETVYDNQGREVISILPVPQDNPAIKYYPSINKNIDDITYSHHDFDWEESLSETCVPDSATPLSDASGAASYYSVDGYDPNTDQDWQQYVPESDGYAFTQVEYTPDNTGRIRRQSGVGNTHKIGSGHETDYFYLQPSQEELNRLFGYKVGNKSHYKKNMVIDANGQVSVSYLDPQGRVVATAMAGNNNTDFESLGSESDQTFHDLTNTDLLNKQYVTATDTITDDNILISTGNFGSNIDALELVTQLGVTEDVPYTFEYDADPGVYTELCEEELNVSYPYVYDLTLTLRNDCGEDLFGLEYDSLIVGEYAIGAAVNDFLDGPLLDTVDLLKGSYTVHKKLSVNKEALENYTADYLSENNACLLPVEDFVPASEDDPCSYSCDDCINELGSIDDFKLRWVTDSLGEYASIQDLSGSAQYYQNIYDQLKSDCLEGCEPTTNCDAFKPLLLGDVSPNGQYAGLVSGTPGNVSIFTSGYWRSGDFITPSNDPNHKDYLDEYGNIELVEAYPIIVNGSTINVPGTSVPQHQLSANGEPSAMVEPWQLRREDFITAFQPSWAEALIEFHPEYPLFEYATAICNQEYSIPTTGGSTFPLSSDNFDIIVRENITDFDMTDASNNQYAIDFITTRPIYDQDPFFQLAYGVHPENLSNPSLLNLTTLKNSLMEYALDTEYKNTGMTMIKYAIKTAIHGNNLQVGIPNGTWNDATFNGFTNEQKTLIWEKYKFYYLSYKAQINQLLMDFHGFDNGIFNGCIGSGTFGFEMIASFIGNPLYFSIAAHTFNMWSNSSLPPFNGLPLGLCGIEFNDKEIRITRFDALYNSGSSDSQILSQSATDADYGQWEQTGLCPLTVDIERLLNALAQDDLLASSTSQADIPEFVPDLYEAFMGVNLFNQYNGNPTTTLNNVIMEGTSFSSYLEIDFDNTLQNATITLTAPTNASTPLGLDWDDYGSVWTVASIEGSFPNGGSNNETEVLLTVVEIGTQITTEYVASYTVTGAATTDITTCTALHIDPNNDPNCKKEEELESDLIAVINAQSINGNFNAAGPISINNESYFVGSQLSNTLGTAGSANWFGTNGANSFSIENGAHEFSFTLNSGQSFPSGIFMITSLDLIINNQVNLVGEFYINAIDDAGDPIELSGTYELRINSEGNPLIGLDVSCPCEDGFAQEIGEQFEDLLNVIVPLEDPVGMQFDALSDLLEIGAEEGFDSESYEIIGSEYSFDSESGCLNYNLGFGENADAGNWTNDDCFTVEICDTSLIGDEKIEYVFNTVFTSTSSSTFAYYYDASVMLDNGEIYNATLSYGASGCLDKWIEECDDCDPSASLQAPVSCTDAYDLYQAEIESLYNMSSYTPGSIEWDIFENEIITADTFFCESSYAFITDAYLYYLTELNITSPEQMSFITISDFGNTYLGYSNTLLEAAVDEYVLDIASDTNDLSTYQDWSTYMSTTYFEANQDICPAMMPDPYIPDLDLNIAPCDLWEQNIDAVNTVNQYDIYLEQVEEAFIQAYIQGAMESVVETFTESHLDKEYHYTLYYYDKAGNLIQTVPPKGVKRFEFDGSNTPVPGENGDVSQTHSDINDVRVNQPEITTLGSPTDRLAPEHTHKTRYRYNSLNQLVYQETPDGGISRFAYDDLGRLVVSQNATQRANLQYSYTVYDGLGRVVEVGEMTTPQLLLAITDEGKLVYTALPPSGIPIEFDVNSLDWINNASTSEIIAREEVTRTVYDELAGITAPFIEVQGSSQLVDISVRSLFGMNYAYDNTRNRIVGVVYQENYDADINSYESGVFYDYDVHGNVKHLIQIYNRGELQDLNQHIKHTEYEYDLVSGNVNKVIYQKGRKDQFIHRYSYDADNRITIAETSKDDVIFEKDAKYFYYEHGPLARTELGEDKVQACDYAYTVQGWIKSVNGEEIDETTMMGQDGKIAEINAMGARDLHGYSLSYFEDDYDAANTTMLNFTPNSTSMGQSLFNGNIRTMVTAIADVDENALKTHQTNYQYDQLNRIKSMNGVYQEIGNLDMASGYSSSYTYDDNGNLDSLKRNATDGNGTSILMDDFKYHYNETVNNGFNNQLSGITEGASTTQFNDDIQNTITAANYEYDAIGQLVKDVDEGIDNIKWKVNNKVEEIEYSSGKIIHFDYDPMGNRIAKHVTGGGKITSTYYVLDAQGNQMSIYKNRESNTNTEGIFLSERNIYGSDRVGQEQVDQLMEFETINDIGKVDFGTITIENTNQSMCSTGGVLNITETNNPVYIFDYDITDYDSDGNMDLLVNNNPTPSTDPDLLNTSGYTTAFSAHLMINTVVGESYTVDFDVLDISSDITGFGAINCPVNTINASIAISSPGSYSVTFTATSAVSRLKWFNDSPDNGYAQIVLSNVSVNGPGDILGTGSTTPTPQNYLVENEKGDKRFELKNHLGNVLEVITDRKLPEPNVAQDEVLFYLADVVSYSDYFPFGMQIAGERQLREPDQNGDIVYVPASGNDGSYRYGFQGQEKDDEVKGEGNSINYKFRMHDPRVGRFFAVDPLFKEYPYWTPYAFSGNQVVHSVEIEGLETDDNLNENEDDKKEKSNKKVIEGKELFRINFARKGDRRRVNADKKSSHIKVMWGKKIAMRYEDKYSTTMSGTVPPGHEKEVSFSISSESAKYIVEGFNKYIIEFSDGSVYSPNEDVWELEKLKPRYQKFNNKKYKGAKVIVTFENTSEDESMDYEIKKKEKVEKGGMSFIRFVRFPQRDKNNDGEREPKFKNGKVDRKKLKKLKKDKKNKGSG